MTGLPREARRQLAAEISSIGAQSAPGPAIPVTASGWATVLDDAGIVPGGRFELALRGAHAGAATDDPSAIRSTTRELARATEQLLDDLRLVEAFQPSDDGRTTSARAKITEIASDAINAVIECDVSGHDRRSRTFSRLVSSMESNPHIVDDRLASIFGVAHSELVDDQGRTSVERIVATLHQRGGRGGGLLGPILAPVTEHPPQGYMLIRAALPHLTGPRPLTTLRTAVMVQELILKRVETDASETGEVLRTLKNGIERSAASHRGIMRVEAELAGATAPSDVAYLTLDVYRRIMESQVRPWAWALLRLCGAPDRNTPPELGTMRAQLTARPELLLRAWAAPILSAVRNAAAHEDFTWDHEAQVLCVGTDIVTAEALRAATLLGYSLMIGAESGWACARATSPRLARELDADDSPGGSRTLSLSAALTRFGTNGLHVHAATWEGDVVAIELDELNEPSINPCFQAVVESIEWVRPNWFEIRVGGTEEPIMRLSAATVGACRELWLDALQHHREMPTAVFLPLNIEARLRVDETDVANRAAAWLALDGALRAYETTACGLRQQAAVIAHQLGLARKANEIVQGLLPGSDADPFDSATRAIHDAEIAARASIASLTLIDPTKPVRQMRSAFGTLERPLILPTLGV